MQEERQAAMIHAHKRAEEETKTKSIQKRQAEQYTLKQQMKQEEEARAAIERAKQTVIDQTSDDIEKWKAKEEQAAKILELDDAKQIDEISVKTKDTVLLSEHDRKQGGGGEVSRLRNVTANQQRQGKDGNKPQKWRKRNEKQPGVIHCFVFIL
jgi:hypothetical protein